MTSDDELEPTKTPTAAPAAAEPTLDELLRMIKETHAETAGLHAAIKEVTAVAKAGTLEAERLASGVEAFVNIMAQVHQRQTTIEDRLINVEVHQKQTIEDRLTKIESWQQQHDDDDEPNGPSP